jgi:transposase
MEACSSAHHWGRQLLALGFEVRLIPPAHGRVTKMGDRYLRKMLVVGACSTLSHRKGHIDALRRWASGMLERKTVRYKFKPTAVALANKVAHIVFVLMTRGGQYDDRPVAA